MKKFLFATFITVAVCVLIVGVLAPVILKNMKVQTLVRDGLNKQFGREISFSRIDVGFLPTVSLKIKDLQVKEADYFDAPNLVAIKTLSLRLHIPSLLLRKIQIKKSILEGVVVTIREKEDKNNIKELIVDQAIHASGKKRTITEEPDEIPGHLPVQKESFDFLVHELIVKDVDVYFERRKNNERVLLRHVGIKSGRVKNFGFLKPVDFSLFMMLVPGEKPIAIDGRFSVDSRSFLDSLEVEAQISATQVRLKAIAEEYFPSSKYILKDGFSSLNVKVHKAMGDLSLKLSGNIDVQRGYMPVMMTKAHSLSAINGSLTLDLIVALPFDSIQVNVFDAAFGKTLLSLEGKVDVVNKLLSGTLSSSHCDAADFPLLQYLIDENMPQGTDFSGVSRFDLFIEGNYFKQNLIGNIDFTGNEFMHTNMYKKQKDFPCVVEMNLVADAFKSLSGAFDLRFGTMTVKGDVQHFDLETISGDISLHSNKFVLDPFSEQIFPDYKYFASGKAKIFCNVRGNFLDLPNSKFKVDVTLEDVSIAQDLLQVHDLNGAFALDSHTFEVKDFSLAVHQSTFKGWMKVDEYKEKPILNFDLYSERCDLDSLFLAYDALVTHKADNDVVAEADDIHIQEAKTIEVSLPDSAQKEIRDFSEEGELSLGGKSEQNAYTQTSGEGAFYVEHLTYLGTPFKEFKGVLQMREGVTHLTNCSVQGFDGTIVLDSQLDFSKNVIPFSGVATLSGIDLDKVYLFAQGPGTESLVEGVLSGSLTVSGAGFTLPELEKSLTGTGTVIVTDGELKSIDILKAVSTAKQFLGLGSQAYGGTRFRDIEANFNLLNGKLVTDDISLVSDDLSLKAAGSLSLRGDLDLALDVLLGDPLVLSVSGDEKDDQMITIPIKISGTVEKPRYSVAGAVVRKIVDQLIQKGLSSLLNHNDAS